MSTHSCPDPDPAAPPRDAAQPEGSASAMPPAPGEYVVSDGDGQRPDGDQGSGDTGQQGSTT